MAASAGERLQGVVIDGAGNPVAAIAVTATTETAAGGGVGSVASTIPTAARADSSPTAARADTSKHPAPPVVAVTDGEGRFTLSGLSAGRHRLTLEGAAIYPSEVRFVAAPGDELRLVISRRVGVAGNVTDQGQPVVGALVALDGEGVAGTRTAVTAVDGGFAFGDLPEGSYRVWAWKGDLAARGLVVPRLGPGGFEDVTLRLEPAAIVVGRVVDRQTGGGVAAAVILTPSSDGGMADEAPRYVRTGDDGVFRVEGVPHGRWSADAWAPGWVTIGSVDFAAGRGQPEVEVVPGGIIEGTVVDAAGRPVAGATVSAREDVARGGVEISAMTDEERLRRYLGQGQRRSRSWAAERASATDDRDFLARGELGVLLGPIPYPPPPGAARARQAVLVDSGPRALGGPDVSPVKVDPAYAPTWVTGSDGRFRLTGVPPGDFVVVADTPGFPLARSRPLALKLGQVVTGVELVLIPGRHVAGAITNQRGEPVSGALATFVPRGSVDRFGVVEAISGSDGGYRAGPLLGAVRVRVSAYGHAEVERELEVGAGDSTDLRFDVVLTLADAGVTGVVQDPGALPVRGARVVVEAEGSSGRSTVTGDGGQFAFDRLPAGSLTLRIEHPDFPVQRFRTETGADPRWTLRYGGGLELVVFDHHTGAHLAGIAVAVAGPPGAVPERRELSTGADGRVALTPIVAGRWSVEVAVPGYVRRTATVEVPAGDRPRAITVRELRIELERGALIAGRVRDRFGNRVAGARVVLSRGDDSVVATSDSDGEYRMRDVPTGSVEVTATKASGTGQARLELRPGDEQLAVELTID